MNIGHEQVGTFQYRCRVRFKPPSSGPEQRLPMIKISSADFFNSLPEHVRTTIDGLTPAMLGISWPHRFAGLLSVLESMTDAFTEDHRLSLIHYWVLTVSGLLERLPDNPTQPEHLALMRYSVIGQRRQSAILRTPDIGEQNALLRSRYPRWSAVEKLLFEYEIWAAGQSPTLRH